MAKLVIKGTLPGFNEYIEAERTSRYKAAAMKRQCQHLVIITAKSQLRKFRAERPVRMTYRWYEKDRRRDKSNVCAFGRKVIEDGLIKAGVLRGDGWAHVEGFADEFYIDSKNPRVEVLIEEVEL